MANVFNNSNNVKMQSKLVSEYLAWWFGLISKEQKPFNWLARLGKTKSKTSNNCCENLEVQGQNDGQDSSWINRKIKTERQTIQNRFRNPGEKTWSIKRKFYVWQCVPRFQFRVVSCSVFSRNIYENVLHNLTFCGHRGIACVRFR